MKVYTKNQLDKIADDFLIKHGKRDGGRLIVHVILENQGYKIYPVAGLFAKQGVDAYIGNGDKVIFVDEELMNSDSMRYTFTLAEELAHSLLHIRSRKTSVVFSEVRRLSKNGYQRMERDAKYLAGALLMPKLQFAEKYHEHYNKHYSQMEMARSADEVTSAKYALRQLYQTYYVSMGGATHRARELGLITASTHHAIISYLKLRS